MSRFFVPPECVGEKTIEITDRGDLHHMRKVLRMRPGDEAEISDTERFEYLARLESLAEDVAVFSILDKQGFAREPETRVTLFQGIPKQGKMESIIQKCVELGVHRIVPVFMERTVVVDRGNFGKKIDRWQKVSAEAVKQCRRGIVPEVEDALRMPEVVGRLADYDLVLIPYENEEGTTIRQVLREAGERQAPGRSSGGAGPKAPGAIAGGPKEPGATAGGSEEAGLSVAVLIGPEGGFAEREVEEVVAAGGRSVTLGKTILRTETAGPAALAMIMYELEMA